jgi:nitrile hydratase accessory protein
MMNGSVAPPRSNGELVFAAPWEGRAFALAVAVVEHAGLGWDTFRRRLIEAIAAQPDRPYYESWTVALESLIVGLNLTTPEALDAATPTERLPL